MVKLDHIAIYVANLQRSIRFYRDCLGLSVARTQNMGDHTLTYFDIGGCELELVAFETPRDKVINAGTHIAFVTEDLGAVFSQCKALGLEILQEPRYIEALHSIRMMVLDWDGAELEFIQP